MDDFAHCGWRTVREMRKELEGRLYFLPEDGSYYGNLMRREIWWALERLNVNATFFGEPKLPEQIK